MISFRDSALWLKTKARVCERTCVNYALETAEIFAGLNPRPLEVISIIISLGSAAFFLFSDQARSFHESTEFVYWRQQFSILASAAPLPAWGAVFLIAGTIHLVGLALGYPTLRRVIMGFKLVWSVSVCLMVWLSGAFFPSDILYGIYAFCCIWAFAQLRLGQNAPSTGSV